MEQFNTIPTSGNWSDIAGILDANFFRCYTALVQSESLVGLSGSNFQGIYTSASALPDEMSSSGWALVGSSLSALTLYVYNTSSSEWGALNNVTYNFTDFSEFQNQLDALSSQLTQIGSKLDELKGLTEYDVSFEPTEQSWVGIIKNYSFKENHNYVIKVDYAVEDDTRLCVFGYNNGSEYKVLVDTRSSNTVEVALDNNYQYTRISLPNSHADTKNFKVSLIDLDEVSIINNHSEINAIHSEIDAINSIINADKLLTCETVANEAIKVIDISDFTLREQELLKVKMLHKNSSEDTIFLNIGDSGNKQLYYNDNPASRYNTWSDGDVLDLIYDGSKYLSYSSEYKFNTELELGPSSQYVRFDYTVKKGCLIRFSMEPSTQLTRFILNKSTVISQNNRLIDVSGSISEIERFFVFNEDVDTFYILATPNTAKVKIQMQKQSMFDVQTDSAEDLLASATLISGSIVTPSGDVVSTAATAAYSVTDFIEVNEGDIIKFANAINNGNPIACYLYGEGYTKIKPIYNTPNWEKPSSGTPVTRGPMSLIIEEGVKYIRYNVFPDYVFNRTNNYIYRFKNSLASYLYNYTNKSVQDVTSQVYSIVDSIINDQNAIISANEDVAVNSYNENFPDLNITVEPNNGAVIYIRTSFDNENDIIIQVRIDGAISLTRNKVVDIANIWVGGKQDDNSSIMVAANRFHSAHDSNPPINTKSYGYLGGNHGIPMIKLTLSSTDKDANDIGSIFSTTNAGNFILADIYSSGDNTIIWLSPVIKKDDTHPYPYRDWNGGTIGGNAFTYVSGGTHQTNIVIGQNDSITSSQYPKSAIKHTRLSIKADGENVVLNKGAVFTCKHLVIYEDYNIVDQSTISSFLKMDGQPLAQHSYIHEFIGSSYTMHSKLTAYSDLYNIYYAPIQPVGVRDFLSDGTITSKAVFMLPKTNSLKEPTFVDDITPSSVVRDASTLVNINDVPDRAIWGRTGDNGSNPQFNGVAYASGLSLIHGDTINKIRIRNIPENNVVLTLSAPTDYWFKAYMRQVGDSILKQGNSISCMCYSSYFKPNSDYLMYDVYEADTRITYIHIVSAVSSQLVIQKQFSNYHSVVEDSFDSYNISTTGVTISSASKGDYIVISDSLAAL